jgi:large subunit ribosomal protein L20
MNRIIRGTTAKKRRKKIIKQTMGCFGSHSKLFTTSNQQYMKSKSYAFSDRKKKKRTCRRLWIVRINASFENKELKYKTLIKDLKKKTITINRKVLSTLTLIDKSIIDRIIDVKI